VATNGCAEIGVAAVAEANPDEWDWRARLFGARQEIFVLAQQH
jgi:hypothetical protein